MVQILERQPTTSDRLFEALGLGAEGLARGMMSQHEQRQLQQKMQKENAFLKRLTGEDVSGLVTPELRKEYLSGAMKNKKQQQQQSFLDKILNKPSENKLGSEITLEDESPIESRFLNLSDEDIIHAENQGIKGLREAKNAALKKIENKRKEEQTQFQSDREYHSKVSQPIIDAAQETLKQSPIKRGLIAQQRRDIESGNTSGLIPFLVERTGFEAYRNPESARFKTASKQRFVESLHEIGGANARPNQFIEQQLTAAQPTLGRDIESNQTVLDLEEFVEDMKDARAKLELQLAEEDREKYGFARNDISQRADKMMGDYANKRQEQMAYSIRKRHEDNLSDEVLTKEIVSGKVPADTPLTLRTARILMIKNNDNEKAAQAEAKRLGFRIPKE